MAKKVLTPEEYKDKMTKKADVRKRFLKSFLTALAYALACVIVFSMVTIAFTKGGAPVVATGTNTSNVDSDDSYDDSDDDSYVDDSSDDTADDTSNDTADDSSNGTADDLSNDTADDTNNDADDSSDDTANETTAAQSSDDDTKTEETTKAQDSKDDAKTEETTKAQSGKDDAKTEETTKAQDAISASSSKADIVKYFNTAINKVKPDAKKITLKKEKNSSAGDLEGNLPGTLKSMANSLISSNMGEKDLSSLPADQVNATSTKAKNAMFPVENENWSSKLTADDVKKAEVKDNGSSYKITLEIKADEPSTSTAHGKGHNGKVFSVISPSIVTDNAGPAASIIKEVKTGHKDGKVTVVVDKATGNVTSATYYFVWTLSVKALGAEISIPFGLEKQFEIAW